MRLMNLKVFVTAVAALLGLSAVSRADVTATLTGLDPFSGATIYLGGSGIGGGGVGLLEWDGAQNDDAVVLGHPSGHAGNPTLTANPVPFNAAFNTFCIDLNALIYFGGVYTFTTEPVANPGPGVPIGTSGNNLTGAQVNQLEGLFGTYLSDVTSQDAIQGFQLAIWSIIYNPAGTTTVTDSSDNFYIDPSNTQGFSGGVDATAISDADTWLGGPYTTFDHDLTAMIAVGSGQNQVITGGPIFTTTTVPVPSAALGGAVLLAGLGLVRFSRRLIAA
jgi:hypothetical protein